MMFFRKNAILGGLCQEWDSMWGACKGNKERLMNLVLMQQSAPYFASFCYNGAGLSKDYCIREFGQYINGRVFHDCDQVKGYTYGMYIGASQATEMALDVSQYLWCDDMCVTIPQCKCPRLYISNKSCIHLTLEGYNTVWVYLFDESELVIDDADETCKVIVYRYSNKATVERGKYCLTDGIKVFDKELRL